eukprot:1488865-Pyramimonas_sp.AAC.1
MGQRADRNCACRAGPPLQIPARAPRQPFRAGRMTQAAPARTDAARAVQVACLVAEEDRAHRLR